MKTILHFLFSIFHLPSSIHAVNEVAVAESDAIAAVNEIKRDGDWVLLAPYGEFPNVVGLQHFTRTEAQEVVNEFQSLLNTPSRLLGLPWYIGHPDHEPMKQRYKDTKAYGRIKELQARDDGLYGRVKWSEPGKQLIADESFHGHSVNWAMKKVGTKWHPFRLKSVGFTNEPQIPTPPVTAANEQHSEEMNIQKLIQILGLAADATEDQIEQAVTGLRTTSAANETRIAALTAEITASRGQITTVTGQLTAVQAEAANERAARADLLIAEGVRKGKILPAEKDAWKTKFQASFSEAANELQTAKAKLNTQSRVNGLGQRHATTQTDRVRKIRDAVNERMTKCPRESHYEAWMAVKREKPDLFAEATN